MSYQNLISPDLRIRQEEALRLLDAHESGEEPLYVDQVMRAVEHIVSVEGVEGNVGTLLWIVYASGRWMGEMESLVDRIGEEGNFEARVSVALMKDDYENRHS